LVLGDLRQDWADEVFELFDLDDSGDLTPQEFLFLMRSQDPDLTESEVMASMALTGMNAADHMSKEQFYVWMHIVFGKMSEEEFVETMKLITEIDEDMILGPARMSWSDRLFDTFDEDRSGTINLNEFVKLVQCVAPETTREDVEVTFRSAGVTNDEMERYHFYAWVSDVFGLFDDREFEETLRAMIRAK